MSRPLYVQKKGTGKKKNSSEVSRKTKDKARKIEKPLPLAFISALIPDFLSGEGNFFSP
jgi:hypothetical protein